MSRYPIPTVRLIIPDSEGRVLILRRKAGKYGNGGWCLPGGKVDYGDTIEQTIVKELYEETSLQVINSKFLFYQDSLPLEEGKMHCINLYFECTTSGIVVLNHESIEFKWISSSEIKDYNILFGNDIVLMDYWR
jgi:8-oxo-dGTP pyrophosphatase MutT (NUDIX family)